MGHHWGGHSSRSLLLVCFLPKEEEEENRRVLTRCNLVGKCQCRLNFKAKMPSAWSQESLSRLTAEQFNGISAGISQRMDHRSTTGIRVIEFIYY